MESDISQFNRIDQISDYFQKIWEDGKPICKLFKTDSTGYLYDTGTNKIVGCNNLEFNLLNKLVSMDIDNSINNILLECDEQKLLNTAQNIKNIIEKENILLTKTNAAFTRSRHFYDLDGLLQNSLDTLQLEMTKDIETNFTNNWHHDFSPNHKKQNEQYMTKSTAFAAIDYVLEHSKLKNKISIIFGGEEPLLQFPLIKSCVEYVHNRLTDKNVNFLLITDAKSLTSEIADFLASEKEFSVLVKFDVSEYSKNRCAKDTDIISQQALTGLKNLYKAFGESYLNRVGIRIVSSAPYSKNSINTIKKLWDKYTVIKNNMITRFSFPSNCNTHSERISENIIIDMPLSQNSSYELSNRSAIKKDLNEIFEDKLATDLVYLYQRPIFPKPLYQYSLNRCCLPAIRKLVVAVDGTFHICDQLNGAPEIGNAKTGLDIDKIKKIYVDDYAQKCLPFCARCWAIQLCRLCYVSAVYKGKIDMKRKQRLCEYFRSVLETDLIEFCQLLEAKDNKDNYFEQNLNLLVINNKNSILLHPCL